MEARWSKSFAELSTFLRHIKEAFKCGNELQWAVTKMKSTSIITELLAAALFLAGCTQVSSLSFRELPTTIEPRDVVAVIVSGEITDVAADAERCITKALGDAFPALQIIS